MVTLDCAGLQLVNPNFQIFTIFKGRQAIYTSDY